MAVARRSERGAGGAAAAEEQSSALLAASRRSLRRRFAHSNFAAAARGSRRIFGFVVTMCFVALVSERSRLRSRPPFAATVPSDPLALPTLTLPDISLNATSKSRTKTADYRDKGEDVPPQPKYKGVSEDNLLGKVDQDAEEKKNNRKANNRKLYRSPHPVEAMSIDRFPNQAVEREVHRHDRWIVESLAYLNQFDSSRAAEYEQIKAELVAAAKKNTNVNTSSSSLPPSQPITIVVLAVNRAVPYLAVLVAMLLRGHGAETFLSRIDVHVVNIERRDGKEDFYFFDYLKRMLPFLTFHDWTDTYEENNDLVADATKWYLANQRLDYIRALELCREAETPEWCIVLEDDAVPCVGFATKFAKLVTGETLRVRGERFLPFKKDAGGGASVVISQDSAAIAALKGTKIRKEKIGKLKLYMPFNHGHGRGRQEERDILSNDYARNGYLNDRALDVWEANATEKVADRVDYKLRYSTHAFGVVAEAYPAGVLDRLIAYLQKQSIKDGDGQVRPLDVLVNLDFFKQDNVDLVQLEFSPSLVQHIGHVSEHVKESVLFRRISTDVRFVLDGGGGLHDA